MYIDPSGNFIFVLPFAIGAAEVIYAAGVAICGYIVINDTIKIVYDASETAKEIIGKYKKGSIWGEFPKEYSEKTMGEIEKDAKAGNKQAQKAKKLLKDKDFDKGSNSNRSKKGK
ncbi:MAG: hypothetical protein GX587_02580 [Bacteroidales bacterium]|nr:hypothetical protein [Bacteroidales bacterium]